MTGSKVEYHSIPYNSITTSASRPPAHSTSTRSSRSGYPGTAADPQDVLQERQHVRGAGAAQRVRRRLTSVTPSPRSTNVRERRGGRSRMTDRANGSTIGRYRLDGLLGRGGMGEVYRAYDTAPGTGRRAQAARRRAGRRREYRERFRRESHVAARLSDPHIIPIHDFGEIDGRLFLDMRLVDGVDLDRCWPTDRSPSGAPASSARSPRRSTPRTGRLIHRDVKPSNVLLVTPRTVRLPRRLRHRPLVRRRRAHRTGRRSAARLHGAGAVRGRPRRPYRPVRAGLRPGRVPDGRTALRRGRPPDPHARPPRPPPPRPSKCPGIPRLWTR